MFECEKSFQCHFFASCWLGEFVCFVARFLCFNSHAWNLESRRWNSRRYNWRLVPRRQLMFSRLRHQVISDAKHSKIILVKSQQSVTRTICPQRDRINDARCLNNVRWLEFIQQIEYLSSVERKNKLHFEIARSDVNSLHCSISNLKICKRQWSVMVVARVNECRHESVTWHVRTIEFDILESSL